MFTSWEKQVETETQEFFSDATNNRKIKAAVAGLQPYSAPVFEFSN
jgi:5-methylcytosine-specific restriction endonuclease McrBC regulatory subunit McrC